MRVSHVVDDVVSGVGPAWPRAATRGGGARPGGGCGECSGHYERTVMRRGRGRGALPAGSTKGLPQALNPNPETLNSEP